MRLTHFGIATSLLILTALHAAVNSMQAAHQLPMVSYINLAIFFLPAAALMLHAYLLVKAKAKKAQGAMVKPLASSAVDPELIAIGKSMMQRAERTDANHAHDALAYGMSVRKVTISPGGTVSIDNVAIKDIFKQAEVTPTNKREASTAAEMNDLASARARLWAELQRPDSESTKLAIPPKAVIIGMDPGKVGGDHTAIAKIDRLGRVHSVQTFSNKRQGHGGARKRAKERRAAVAV